MRKSNKYSLKCFYWNIWSLQDKTCVICVDQVMQIEMLLLRHYGGVDINEKIVENRGLPQLVSRSYIRVHKSRMNNAQTEDEKTVNTSTTQFLRGKPEIGKNHGVPQTRETKSL